MSRIGLCVSLAFALALPSVSAHYVNAQEPPAEPDEGFELETEETIVMIDSDGVITSGDPDGFTDQCVESQIQPGQMVCFGGSTEHGGGDINVSGAQWHPFLPRNPDVQHAFGWIADEALLVIPALYGVPADGRVSAYARAEFQAYLQTRLLGILDIWSEGGTLTPEEQRAFDYLVGEIQQRSFAAIDAAWEEYLAYDASPCSYDPPSAPPWIDDPVVLSYEINKWCTIHNHGVGALYTIVPPIPSPNDFITWGEYAVAPEFTLQENQLLNEGVGEQLLGSIALGGIVVSIAASVGAGFAIGSSAVLGAIVSKAIGSMAVVAAMQAYGGTLAAKIAAGMSVGAIAGAAVIGIVIFMIIGIALAITYVIEYDNVGSSVKKLRDLAVDSIPYWLANYREELDGTAVIDAVETMPAPYREDDLLLPIARIIQEATSVETDGTILTEPSGLWTPNLTTDDDWRFRVVSEEPARIVDQISYTEALDTEHPNRTLRFNQGWMISGNELGAAQARLNFRFLDENDEPQYVARAPRSDLHPDGGFYVTSLARDGLQAEFTERLTIPSAEGTIEVELVAPASPPPPSLRPAAAGKLTVDWAVNLRPNPVDGAGAFDPDAYTTGYDYEWTVDQVEGDTRTTVLTAAEYGPTFVPTEPGTYVATVSMNATGASPETTVTASVSFEVGSPEFEIRTLDVIDDGESHAYIDLEVAADTADDTFTVEVQWPAPVGGPEPAPVVFEVGCVQTGPVECTTPSLSGDHRLSHDLDRFTDAASGVQVSITNSTGLGVTEKLAIASPQRPHLNDGNIELEIIDGEVVPIEFSPTSTRMQAVVGFNPYRTVARVTPGTIDGPVVSYGLAVPDTPDGQTANSIGLLGDDLYQVTLVETESGELLVRAGGWADIEDLGSHRFPITVLQADSGGVTSAAQELVVTVTPAINGKYRSLLLNTLPISGGVVDTLPELVPLVAGGAEATPYTGDICFRLYPTSFPPTAQHQTCVPAAPYVDAQLDFPYELLRPTGLESGAYRAATWLSNDALASTEPHEVSFRIPSDQPAVDLQIEDPSPDDTRLVATIAAADTLTIEQVDCTIDGAPLAPCVGTSGGTLALGSLGAGTHELAVMAYDSFGNYRHAAVSFEIEEPPPPTTVPPTTAPPTTVPPTTAPPTTVPPTTAPPTTVPPTTAPPTTVPPTTAPPTTVPPTSAPPTTVSVTTVPVTTAAPTTVPSTATTTTAPTTTTSVAVTPTTHAPPSTDLPVTTTAPPSGSGTEHIDSSGPMTSNSTVNLTVRSKEIERGRFYRGILRSTPVDLPATLASTAGSVTFHNITLPADFGPGEHTVTLIDAAGPLATIRMIVGSSGEVTASSIDLSPSGDLPATGTPIRTLWPMLLLLLGLSLLALSRTSFGRPGATSKMRDL